MALWKNTKTLGFQPEPLLHDSLTQDVFLCGCGPSLKNVQSSDLRGAGLFVAAVNNAYPHITPDIWFGMDDPHCYSRQVFWEPFIKIMRGGYQNRTCEGREISKNYNLFYADCVKFDNHEDIFTVNSNNINFIWKNNVLAIAIHVLIWMGAKRIYLVGCDLSNKKSSYHHQQQLSDHNTDYNARLYKEIIRWTKWLHKTAKKYDIEIISCTPESPINEFMPYMTVENAKIASSGGLPNGGELHHTRDIPAYYQKAYRQNNPNSK